LTISHRAIYSTLACLLFFAVAVPGPAAASDPAATLGVYAGSGDAEAVGNFERSLGRPVGYVHDYLDKRSWTTISSATWLADTWRASGRNDKMVISVPILPDTGGTLAEGATGSYNQHFEQLARTLIDGGQGSAVLRPGFEFNGTWFRWSIAGPGNAAAFAEYWRQIIQTMRAVPGADFKFDWSPSSGSSWVNGQPLNPEEAWPGDAYVDYIGLDQYDQSWAPNYTDPVARWEANQTQPYGMRWHRDFAAAHNKPMTFPEWGLAIRTDGHGGGDAPYFIEQMHQWIATNNVAYHLYFEYADSVMSSQIFGGSFPLAAERFVTLFGATGGSPEPTPAPTASYTYSPTAPTVGQAVSFDGRGSSCEATPCTYRWEDGTTVIGSGTTLTHSFSTSGSHQLKLTVTDARSRVASTTKTITVSEPVTRTKRKK
jgi:hypothetical protein